MKPAEISKWFNAIADAYARGEAPWAYPNSVSLAVQVWNRVYQTAENYDTADIAVIELAKTNNISLKRRKNR